MKKSFFSFLLLLSFLSSFSQEGPPSIRDLKGGRYKADTSYIYSLPFERGSSFLLIQAYDSKFSHKGEYALDFKMKEGTPVCAAREGIVLSTKEDSRQGGLKPEMLNEANYIIIRHGDGSFAHYWHLQTEGVLVHEGDTVAKGQVIGYSGNTGYSAFPHLHFEVTTQNTTGANQVPTRFRTKKGIRYLRPGRWHKAV